MGITYLLNWTKTDCDRHCILVENVEAEATIRLRLNCDEIVTANQPKLTATGEWC